MYLVDFAVYKPDDKLKVSRSKCEAEGRKNVLVRGRAVVLVFAPERNF